MKCLATSRQFCSVLRSAQFAIQLDDSTDVSNVSQLHAYVHYIMGTDIKE